jgi:undecaprenyl pyrophosphate synthase
MLGIENKSAQSRHRNSVEQTKEDDGLCLNAAINTNHNRSFNALRSLLDQVSQNKPDTARALPEISEKTRKTSASYLVKRSPLRSGGMSRKTSGGMIK